MLPLRELLSALFSDAFEACGYERSAGEVVNSQRPDLSQFQCNGALTVARPLRKNPREVATRVLDSIQSKEIFSELTLDGPGFINIKVADDFLAEHLQQMSDDARLLCVGTEAPERIVLDFGGPNVAKSMHVGHLRSSVIGESLKRLLRFIGDDVTSDIHLGDWGTQMGMLISELERRQPNLIYFDPNFVGPYPDEPPVTITELEEMYPTASARSKSDETAKRAAMQATAELQLGRPGYRALWQHFRDVSIAALREDFGSLGVTFDLWYGESRYHDRIPEMLERLKKAGFAKTSEGALVVTVADESDSQPMPPLILVKTDGSYLYGTTDLATIEERVQDLRADRVLYVVDERQSLHFQQVFRAARITGISGEVKLEHVAFGTVNGTDGKPFKTRQGGVMKLQGLISMATEVALARMQDAGVANDYGRDEQLEIARMVGIAALKFADLTNYRCSSYVFDLDKFTRFEGRTGPYLLYAAVRIKSILRKAASKDLTIGPIGPATDNDRELMLELANFPDAVRRAYAGLAPNNICEFAFGLAQVFSRFYKHSHILGEEDESRRASWLALSQLCLKQLTLSQELLGIEIPDRM